MRKKLGTRFPAARIKKIMQADEDVGKIAMAVPLLVSKALELFLQDLCDRTYEITLQRGAKTMSSLHLWKIFKHVYAAEIHFANKRKQCVQRFGVFDFLRHIVSKVPDIGSSDAGGEDKSAKKRKSMEEESNGNEDTKRNKTEMMTGHGHSRRGHGRGRGRGRGRGTHADRDMYDKCEDSADISPQHKTEPHALNSDRLVDSLDATESKEIIVCGTSGPAPVHNFDLNVDLDETGDTRGCSAAGSALVRASDIKLEEYPGWSLPEIGKMPFDPCRFPLSSRHLDEEDDYDNEDD